MCDPKAMGSGETLLLAGCGVVGGLAMDTMQWLMQRRGI